MYFIGTRKEFIREMVKTKVTEISMQMTEVSPDHFNADIHTSSSWNSLVLRRCSRIPQIRNNLPGSMPDMNTISIPVRTKVICVIQSCVIKRRI